jgi:hypothetical protein
MRHPTLAVGLAALLLAASAGALTSKVPAAPKTITAELGKEFVLLKGQSARLKGTDASVRVAGFINSPCPKGARCVWSGQLVQLELTVAGSTVPLNGSAPYDVEPLSSDSTTRASLRASRRAERP